MSKTETLSLQEQLNALKAENEALKAKAEAKRVQKISFKVSEKKALSCYGLGRFPVTLYASQWVALAKAMPALLAFVEENKGTLASKEA